MFDQLCGNSKQMRGLKNAVTASLPINAKLKSKFSTDKSFLCFRSVLIY